MSSETATAISFSNIAFIKYWGNRDDALRLPSNSSLSMNLDGLYTRTQITFDPSLSKDILTINRAKINGEGLLRVSSFLDRVRNLKGSLLNARVNSHNNFPTGAGIASSASAFAALALAATTALGLELSETEISRLARLGSGSACRSIPAGFVEWQAGQGDEDSYAFSIASPDHWDLVDCIALVQTGHKQVGSTQGHALANSSPLQAARVADTPRRLAACKKALLECDFEALAQIIELDSNLMHAVMLTSTPPLIYWSPATIAIMKAVTEWRKEGIPACYTIDAGPNVHVITLPNYVEKVTDRLNALRGVHQVLTAHPGGAAHLVPE